MHHKFKTGPDKRAVAIGVIHKDRNRNRYRNGALPDARIDVHIDAPAGEPSARAVASLLVLLVAALVCLSLARTSFGHIVPPEKLHPVAEAYRRANFVLRLNPVIWEQVRPDVATIAR